MCIKKNKSLPSLYVANSSTFRAGYFKSVADVPSREDIWILLHVIINYITCLVVCHSLDISILESGSAYIKILSLHKVSLLGARYSVLICSSTGFIKIDDNLVWTLCTASLFIDEGMFLISRLEGGYYLQKREIREMCFRVYSHTQSSWWYRGTTSNDYLLRFIERSTTKIIVVFFMNNTNVVYRR